MPWIIIKNIKLKMFLAVQVATYNVTMKSTSPTTTPISTVTKKVEKRGIKSNELKWLNIN